MPRLRLDRLIALTPLVLLLLTSRAALADSTGASVDADKPASNVETVGSPASASGDVPGRSSTAIAAPSVPSQPVTEPNTALDADAPIAEQLHNLANGKFGTHFLIQFSDLFGQCVGFLSVFLLNSLDELLTQIVDLAISLSLSLIATNDADEISCVRF